MKMSCCSSSYTKTKKKKNNSIDLNNNNESVKFSNISCHKEPIIHSEKNMKKNNQRRIKQRRGGKYFDGTSTSDSTNKNISLMTIIINTKEKKKYVTKDRKQIKIMINLMWFI